MNAHPPGGVGLPTGERGFTAIELVAALTATAFIAALGVSAFRTYTVRSQIAQGLSLTSTVQHRVAQAFRAAGVPPANRAEASMPSDARVNAHHLASINVVNGRIDLLFASSADPAIAGRILSLTPFETAEQEIIWICGNAIPGVGLTPLGFADGGNQAVQALTTIETRYLPLTCR